MTEFIIISLIVICTNALLYLFSPSIEKNTETGEYLLFYSIPFSKFVTRKYVKIW